MKRKLPGPWMLVGLSLAGLVVCVALALPLILDGRDGLLESRGQVLALTGSANVDVSVFLQAEKEGAWGFFEWPERSLYGFLSLGKETEGVRRGRIDSGTGKGSAIKFAREKEGNFSLEFDGPGLPVGEVLLVGSREGSRLDLVVFSGRGGKKLGLGLLAPQESGSATRTPLRRGVEPRIYARDLLSRMRAEEGIEEREFLLPAFGGRLASASERILSETGGKEERYLRFLIQDQASGRDIPPAELLGQMGEDRLDALLTAEAERVLSLSAGRATGEPPSLRAYGLFDQRLKPSSGLFVCRSGLGFHFDRYELAPYAQGDFTFVLPWGRLAGGRAP